MSNDRVAVRFFTKVDRSEGCWLWVGYKNKAGYGAFGIGSRTDGSRRNIGAHVWAWQLVNGPVPDGLELDHLCRNTSCVRPDHLEAVTPRENWLRSSNHVAAFAARTHCNEGHALSGSNLELRADGGRRCRTCRNEYMRIWRAQNVK